MSLEVSDISEPNSFPQTPLVSSFFGYKASIFAVLGKKEGRGREGEEELREKKEGDEENRVKKMEDSEDVSEWKKDNKKEEYEKEKNEEERILDKGKMMEEEEIREDENMKKWVLNKLLKINQQGDSTDWLEKSKISITKEKISENMKKINLCEDVKLLIQLFKRSNTKQSDLLGKNKTKNDLPSLSFVQFSFLLLLLF